MKLRALEKKDAPRMLEWMHDPSVVEHLAANFAAKTLSDCEDFIAAAAAQAAESITARDLHLAVVNEADEYMGTVSLKHIDRQRRRAEFAITVRADAMGRGYASWSMREILRMGLEELGLESIYWCVNEVNQRAVAFYEKHAFPPIAPDEAMEADYAALLSSGAVLRWYAVERGKGI